MYCYIFKIITLLNILNEVLREEHLNFWLPRFPELFVDETIQIT